MNQKSPFDPASEASLLSAYVDGELAAADVARIEEHLAQADGSGEATRREIEELRRLGSVTAAMHIKEAPAEEWEAFWHDVYNRNERSLGWILLGGGVAICGVWGAWRLVSRLLATQELPWVVRGGALVLIAGFLVLLVSAVRERVYRRTRSRYKDIIR